MTKMPSPHTRRLPFRIYDCFSDRLFGGNVGGIVFDAGSLGDGEMRAVATEINAPVTGFVTGLDAEALEIRFFMPSGEIAMCGHVTLGLFTELHERLAGAAMPAVMRTRAGDVAVTTTPRPEGGVIVMMALAAPGIEKCDVDRAAVARALAIDEAALCPDLPLEIGATGLRHLFVPAVDLASVRAMAPDFAALSALSEVLSISTVLAFSLETEDPDASLHCRDFCPALGVNEVPASGTSNSALAGYLVKHRLVAPQKGETLLTVLAEQGSEIGRPSLIRSDIALAGGEIATLRVGGSAALSAEGFVYA